MKVKREKTVVISKKSPFKVGDCIKMGRFYTATCQKADKDSAIFLFDQYLNQLSVMNNYDITDGGYLKSDLRKYLKGMHLNPMFDEVRDILLPFESGDLLRIPTGEEMFGPEYAHRYFEKLSNDQRWILMEDVTKRIASYGDNMSIEWGWVQNRRKDSYSMFGGVNTGGQPNGSIANFLRGVRIVFKVSQPQD